MPITGWTCPNCNQQVPLDHYDTDVKCGLVIHPAFAKAIVDDEAIPHYVEGALTVTMGLTCPRSRALEHSDTPVYPNPLDYNALLVGRAWDELITDSSTKIQLHGVIAGMKVSGEIDHVRRLGTDLLIEDWKNSNNNAQKFLKKEIAGGAAVKPEYRIQTSLYAELYFQQFGERATKGMIWNHYAGAPSAYNTVLIPLIYDIWPLEECLSYQPYGGDYTVLELYQQASALYTDEPISWEQLPLVGKTMAFGTKSFCDYCQVRDACFIQAQNAPF